MPAPPAWSSTRIRTSARRRATSQPQPYMMGAMAREAAAAPVPIEAGELTFSINVQVTWELGDN